MLTIRLQRVGKKGQAYFRVAVTEHTKKPKGEALELLGSYDPHQKKLVVKKEKIMEWISKGAQVSPTLNNLMVNYKIWDMPKVQSWKVKVSVKNKKEEAAKAKQAPAIVEKTIEAEPQKAEDVQEAAVV